MARRDQVQDNDDRSMREDEQFRASEDYDREMRFGRSGLQHHNGQDYDREHYGANANLPGQMRKDEHRYDNSTERSNDHPTRRRPVEHG